MPPIPSPDEPHRPLDARLLIRFIARAWWWLVLLIYAAGYLYGYLSKLFTVSAIGGP